MEVHKGQKVGYIRVSTVEQNESRQVKALKEQGVEKVFMEKVSGKDTNRPKLKELLDYVREGDTVFVHSLDRLARNTRDLLTIVETLENKGVGLVSCKEHIDTTSATGKLMLTMLGAMAQFERANILERQREGIEIAKQNGKYKGRKEIEYPTEWELYYKKWKSREITSKEFMEGVGLKKTTFFKLKKKYEEKGENK